MAEPVAGGANAAIITKFAVRHDFETAVARLINTDVPDNVTGVKRFNLTLDGDAVEDGASGLFLTVTTLDNTVRLRMRRATPSPPLS